jgi:hypothetical protein
MKTEEEKSILIKNGISPTTLSMEERYPAYSTNKPPESFTLLKEYNRKNNKS